MKLVRIVGAIGDDLTGGHFDQPTGRRHIVLLSGVRWRSAPVGHKE